MTKEKTEKNKRTPVSGKRKKPKFKRQRTRYKKLKENWRRPRGMNSKQRKGKKETPKKPSIGYGQPREIRGLHPSGYEDKLIHNPNQIEKLNPEKHAIRIAGSVGKRKKEKIIEKAEDKNFKIINK